MRNNIIPHSKLITYCEICVSQNILIQHWCILTLLYRFCVGAGGLEPPVSGRTDLQSVRLPITGYAPKLLSLLSDSNQRPRDYKSRALAN